MAASELEPAGAAEQAADEDDGSLYERFCTIGVDGIERIVGPVHKIESQTFISVSHKSWWLVGSKRDMLHHTPTNDIIHEITNVMQDMRLGKKTKVGRIVDKTRQPLGEVVRVTIRDYSFNAATAFYPPAIEYTRANLKWLFARYAEDVNSPPTTELSKKRARPYSSSPSPEPEPNADRTMPRVVAVELQGDDDPNSESDPTQMLDRIVKASTEILSIDRADRVGCVDRRSTLAFCVLTLVNSIDMAHACILPFIWKFLVSSGKGKCAQKSSKRERTNSG